MKPSELMGAVLAGGRSSRLGRDKALEHVGSASMVERAVAALEPVCESVVVIGSRAGAGSTGWSVVPDLRPGEGPLAGLETALDQACRTRHEAVFVLACDLPLVTAEVVREVLSGLGDGPCAAAAREGTPDHEPLCAVYRSDLLPRVRALLDAGERAAWTLFRAAGGVRVPVASTNMLNVNTEADLSRARAVVADIDDPGARTSPPSSPGDRRDRR